MVLFFVKERQCMWLGRGSNEDEKIHSDGILRSTCFPGLWLDVRAFFDSNGEKVAEALRQGLASPERAKWLKRLQSAGS